MRFNAAVLSLLTLLSSSALGAPLWQKAESGMTIAQVRSAFPAAKPPIGEKSTLKGGTSCELEIAGYEVGSDSYRVCFFFAANKLVQVMLTADTPSEPQFDSVLELLRSKYGREIEAGSDLCKRGMLVNCDANWAPHSGTKVSATYMQIDDMKVLNINYQTRIADDASKL